LYLFEFSKIHFFSEIKVFVSNLLAGIIDCNAFSVVPSIINENAKKQAVALQQYNVF